MKKFNIKTGFNKSFTLSFTTAFKAGTVPYQFVVALLMLSFFNFPINAFGNGQEPLTGIEKRERSSSVFIWPVTPNPRDTDPFSFSLSKLEDTSGACMDRVYIMGRYFKDDDFEEPRKLVPQEISLAEAVESVSGSEDGFFPHKETLPDPLKEGFVEIELREASQTDFNAFLENLPEGRKKEVIKSGNLNWGEEFDFAMRNPRDPKSCLALVIMKPKPVLKN